MAIKTVWIDEGCITCNACEAECPDVFVTTDTTTVIRGEVREDGIEGVNREKSPLKANIAATLEDSLRAAASGCPVEVIRLEE